VSTGTERAANSALTLLHDVRCRKPLPGSEHVSPVSSSANYPPGVAADAAASLVPGTMTEEDSAMEVTAEAVTSASEIGGEKEPTSTDAKNDDETGEEPVSNKQGNLL